MSSPGDDLKAVTEAARDLAYRQIDAQLQASDNQDAKALGVIAFDGAALAAVLLAKDLFVGSSWAVTGLLVLISALFAALSMQSFRWDMGPDPRGFYDSATAAGVTVGSAAKANVDLVSEFGGPTGSIAKNESFLARKGWRLAVSLVALIAAGIASAILVSLHP
jgi:hypothetical protein